MTSECADGVKKAREAGVRRGARPPRVRAANRVVHAHCAHGCRPTCLREWDSGHGVKGLGF